MKNRQPLSDLRVVLVDNSKNYILKEFCDVITEELNVKNINVLDELGDIACLKYDPNFNEIRARYPNRVPELVKAIKSGNFKMYDNEVVLKIDDVEEKFDSEIILVTYIAMDGQHVASNHGIVVSLDLTITEELKQEGLAREIIRNIQEARKQIGCDITDNIFLEFSNNAPLDWLEYMCKETLGIISNIENPNITLTITDDDDKEIYIKIGK